MSVKRRNILGRDDLREALDAHRISVSQISKATGVPRSYISEFMSIGRPLKPDQLTKIREYLKGEGVEFTDEEDATAGSGNRTPVIPHHRLRTVESVRSFFPVSDRVPDAVVARVVDTMDDNDARIAALLKQKVERDEGLLGGGDLSGETKEALQEAGSLLAENYLLFRLVRGWPAFKLQPSGEDPETLHDMLLQVYRQQLEEAGLIKAEPGPDPEDESSGSNNKGSNQPDKPDFPWVGSKGEAEKADAKGDA